MRRKRTRGTGQLGEDLGDGAAEAADDAVLLEGDDGAGLARGGAHRLLVERLQGVHATARARSTPRSASRSATANAVPSMPPVEISVRSPPSRSRIARPSWKSIGPVVDVRLARLAEAEVARPGVRDDGARRRPRLDRVARRHHHHARQHAHDAEVLGGVVRGAQGAVGEAAADRHDLDVGLVVADVVADLLEAAQRREVGDRVGEDDLARSAPCRRRAPVMFCSATPALTNWSGSSPMNRSTTREAEVAGDEDDAAVGLRQLVEGVEEGGPHGRLLGVRRVELGERLVESSPRGAR